MPELPDVELYVESLRTRVTGHVLRSASIRGPFLLRTVEPAVEELYGHRVTGVRRAGKRIAMEFEHGLWLVIHPAHTRSQHWKDCWTPKGTVCVPTKQ